jgi:hypothetical protein
MTRFQPRLDILPEPQKRLWPELREVPRNFVLYGGTAIALRLGHRTSADFDFFSSEPFVPEDLMRRIPCLAESKILQSESQTLSFAVQREGLVKVSFFGGLRIGRVRDPEETQDGVLQAASLLDLAGLKAAVIQKRAEAKDYLDILALLKSGITLPMALGAAQALYRDQFNPMVTLKALSYFSDGDLHALSHEQKSTLTRCATEPIEILKLERLADSLVP